MWDDGVWSEEDWTVTTPLAESGRGVGSDDGWPDDAPAVWAARSWPADTAIDDPAASGSLVPDDRANGDPADPVIRQPVSPRPAMRTIRRPAGPVR